MSRTLSYRDAGVDFDAGDALVEAIKPYAKRTMRAEVLAGIGGFGALCRIPGKYRQPVLVSGTDGVGTKLKLAFALGRHDTVGIDLVALSVNDVLVQGADPLFFLDYYACGLLDTRVAAQVVPGKGSRIGEDSLFNQLFIKYYYEMKKRHGYTELEIAQKREALENVLIPYKLLENREMLLRAGFRYCDVFFKWYNFCGMIAVR